MIKRTQIVKKKCKCQECKDNPEKAKYPTMSCNGFNYNCLTDEEKQVKGTMAKLARRKSNNRKAQGSKLLAAQRKLNGDSELDLWFMLQMKSNDKYCQNCGVSLYQYNDRDWRSSQHHLVDKALCPSVATHPLNHLVLGMWCCHSQWHTSFLNSSKMPVFGEAKRKFQLFKNDIAPDEFKKVNPYLL